MAEWLYVNLKINLLTYCYIHTSNVLTSWNLHDNIRSGTTVTIRFRHCMGSEGSDSSVKPPMYFRRQSPRQAERNKQRAVDYKNNAITATTPKQMEDTNTCMSKKRKINDESPETLRQHESICQIPSILPSLRSLWRKILTTILLCAQTVTRSCILLINVETLV